MDRVKRHGIALLLGIMIGIFPACGSSQSMDIASGQATTGIVHDHDHDHDHDGVQSNPPVPTPEKGADLHPSSDGHEGHDHSAAQSPARWIPVFGIITIVLLFLTTIIGWNIRRKPAFLMPWHKRCAVLTCLSALTHMTLVILYH